VFSRFEKSPCAWRRRELCGCRLSFAGGAFIAPKKKVVWYNAATRRRDRTGSAGRRILAGGGVADQFRTAAL